MVQFNKDSYLVKKHTNIFNSKEMCHIRKRSEYRTHGLSCDWVYMFTGSLQLKDTSYCNTGWGRP